MLSNKKFRALKASFKTIDAAIAASMAERQAVNRAHAARHAEAQRAIVARNAAMALSPEEIKARHEAWLREMDIHRKVWGPK